MLNSITIMGRLVADPELRYTPDGVAVTSIRLACDRDIKNKETGSRETDFIDVVMWRNTAEYAAQHLAKGRLAVVNGRLQMRKWMDKDGNKRTSTEIICDRLYFGESKSDSAQRQEPSAPAHFEPISYDGNLPF